MICILPKHITQTLLMLCTEDILEWIDPSEGLANNANNTNNTNNRYV